MVLSAAVEAHNKRVPAPMPLILRTIPEEGLTYADQDDNNSDESLKTDGHVLGFGGRELGRVRVVVEVCS